MTTWTPQVVEAFLSAAADTAKKLPEPRVPNYFNTWPEVVRSSSELAGFSDGPIRPAAAEPEAISQMEQTMLWLRWLDREDQKIVWARANGRPWKIITNDFGIGRTTAWRRYKAAVAIIAARLNGRGEQC